MSEGLASLEQAPAGVSEATALVAGFDEALRVGFGRLGAEQVRAIDALARAFTGTPLEARVSEAAAAVRRSEFLDKHLAALAVARTALQGTVHDALSALAAKALGREPALAAPAGDPDAAAPPSSHEVLLEGVRAWLLEVALAGFAQLTPDAVLPFGVALEKLQEEPALTRIAVLLTGFQDEILASLPIADDGSNLPLYRWCDLWSRSFVLAQRTPGPLAVTKVSGTFVPVGTDLRQHDSFVSAVVHGLLIDPAGKSPARHVRATLSSYKVDVVFGGEAWGALATKGKELCTALSSGASLTLKDMPCTGAGDLLWNDAKAKSDAKNTANLNVIAPKELAAGATLVRGSLAGGDRHPLQIAELVWLSDVKLGEAGASKEKALVSGGAAVPVAIERLGDGKDFTLEECEGAQGVAALLRHDRGRWALQPLSVVRAAGKKTAVLVSGALGAEAGLTGAGKKSSALPILRERAGKLLRKKS